jgi:hypothetical protein
MNLPSPDALFEGICGLMDLRYDHWTGSENYPGWNELLRSYFSNVAKSFGLRAKDHAFKQSGRTGQKHGGLLWEDGTTEVAAIAWCWDARGSNAVLDGLLKRPEPLKVYLTDSTAEDADGETAKVRELIVKSLSANGPCHILGVVFACAEGSKRPEFVARATKVVVSASTRDILKEA